MAPPPITPAPHRFLPTTSDQSRPTLRPPQLRQQQATPQSHSSSQHQFAPTPRFSLGSSHKKSTGTEKCSRPQPVGSSSPFTSKVVAQEPPRYVHEDIEEPRSDQEDALGVRNETEHDVIDESDDVHEEVEPLGLPITTPSKRRRLNAPLITNDEHIVISSSPLPGASPPIIPPFDRATSPSPPSTPPFRRQPYSTTSPSHPRFRLALPTHPSSPSASVKPPIILPTAPESQPSDLPSALLSPQRRGQKYIPGGMASTVRDWIFEASQSYRGRSVGTKGEGEDWNTRLTVAEARSAGTDERATLLKEVEGARHGTVGRNWMLVGNPTTRDGKNVGETVLNKGAIVEVREPTWAIEVPGGPQWHVGVEWRKLPGGT